MSIRYTQFVGRGLASCSCWREHRSRCLLVESFNRIDRVAETEEDCWPHAPQPPSCTCLAWRKSDGTGSEDLRPQMCASRGFMEFFSLARSWGIEAQSVLNNLRMIEKNHGLEWSHSVCFGTIFGFARKLGYKRCLDWTTESICNGMKGGGWARLRTTEGRGPWMITKGIRQRTNHT